MLIKTDILHHLPTLRDADSPRIWRWIYVGLNEQRNRLLIVCFVLGPPRLGREQDIRFGEPEQILLVEEKGSPEITVRSGESVQVGLPVRCSPSDVLVHEVEVAHGSRSQATTIPKNGEGVVDEGVQTRQGNGVRDGTDLGA